MKPHKFDALSFISGVIFAGLGTLFLVPATNLELVDWVRNVGTWGWPLVFLGAGAAVLATVFAPRKGGDGGEGEIDAANREFASLRDKTAPPWRGRLLIRDQ